MFLIHPAPPPSPSRPLRACAAGGALLAAVLSVGAVDTTAQYTAWRAAAEAAAASRIAAAAGCKAAALPRPARAS